MPLPDFLRQLDELAQQATAAFQAAAAAGSPEQLEAARVQFLGARSGRLKEVQKGLGLVDKADKPAAGKRFNEVKQQMGAAFEAAKQGFAERVKHRRVEEFLSFSQVATGSVTRPRVIADPTVPGVRPRLGHLHPITQTAEELKDIMGRLGFNVADGPEVEDQWHNFEALNIPPEHPARDPLDNFYLAAAERLPAKDPLSLRERAGVRGQPENADERVGQSAAARPHPNPHPQGEGTLRGPHPNPLPEGEGTVGNALPEVEGSWLLRSQTSTVQIRVMEKTKPPVRIISLGRVYRPDTADATHYPMFHQIEGLLIDRQVTMADLKSVLRLFARSFFADDVHIRFRPSFFPFTEPSVEVDMSWHGGWIEMGGAGMVDPNVLEAVGYDPEEVSGFAFGLGIDRLCARQHGVTDIREFFKNDVRFLHQF